MQHGTLRGGHDVDVLGADDHIDGHIVAEALVDALELRIHEAHQAVLHHGTVEDVALADKVGHEAVLRFVIYIGRRTYLLYHALAHHHDGVAQCERLLLVVGDVDEGDAQRLVHLLELHLHVLAHLEVQCGKGFVEQEHGGLVHDGACYGHALLLSARERVHVAMLIVRHAHHLQGASHLVLYDVGLGLLQLQAEGDVVVYVEVWK